MIWLLPVIVIGGLFYPVLGYLVVGMISFFLPLSFFKKGRFWCWNYCPRGAFLDGVMSKMSFKKPVPQFFFNPWVRWSVFVLLMGFLTYRIIQTGGNPILIGSVFVLMCVITTVIAILLSFFFKSRAWCMVCPMGNLQERIGKIPKNPPPKS